VLVLVTSNIKFVKAELNAVPLLDEFVLASAADE